MKSLYIVFLSVFFKISSLFSTETHKTYVVFRFDDFHLKPTSFNYSLINLFKKYNLPLCLGIIPNKDDTLIYKFSNEQLLDFRQRIRNKEIEVALHGYNHKDNEIQNKLPWSKNYKSEFQDRSYLDQFYRIQIAKNVLETILQCSISVFIPPWNSYDENTLLALENLNFRIVSSDLNGKTSSKNLSYIPVLIEDYHNLKSLFEKNNKNHVLTVMIHPYSFAADEEFTTMAPHHYKNLEDLLKYIKNDPDIEVLSFAELNKTSNYSAARYKAHSTKNNFLSRLLLFYDNSLNKFYKNHEQQNDIKRILIIFNIVFHLLLFAFTFIFSYLLMKNLLSFKTSLISYLSLSFIFAAFLIYIVESPAFLSLFILFSTIDLGMLAGLLTKRRKKNRVSEKESNSLKKEALYTTEFAENVQLRS